MKLLRTEEFFGENRLTLIKGALKIMTWTKTKTTIVVSAVVLLAIGA